MTKQIYQLNQDKINIYNFYLYLFLFLLLNLMTSLQSDPIKLGNSPCKKLKLTLTQQTFETPKKKPKYEELKIDIVGKQSTQRKSKLAFYPKEIHQHSSARSSVKQIYSEQKKSHRSPFTKGCFQKTRIILSIQQLKSLKKINSQTERTPRVTKSLQKPQKTFQSPSKKIELKQKITDMNQTNQTRSVPATHYSSVKIFMSSKFKKGIKGKLPVNILAVPQTIHQKQPGTDSVTTNSLRSSRCLLQTIMLEENQDEGVFMNNQSVTRRLHI